MSAYAVSDLSLIESPVQSLCPSRFQLNSQCFYREYNDGSEGGEGEGGEGQKEGEKEKEGEKGKEDEKEGEKGKGKEKEPEPGSAEARIQGALDAKKAAEERAEEAERKLKEKEEAEAQAEKKKLEEAGEHQKLREQAEEEAKKAKEDLATANEKVKTADKFASDSVETALKGIKDEAKRDAVKRQLEGKSPLEQLSAIGDLLALAGAEGNHLTPVGSGILPESGAADKTEISQKQERFVELREKSQKHNKGNGDPLTPAEKREMVTIAREIDEHKRKNPDTEGGHSEKLDVI